MLAVMGESSVTRAGDPIAYYLEQWLAGEPDSSFLLIRPPEPGKPMVYIVADLAVATWEAWPSTPDPIWSRELPGGTRAALLSFGDVAGARRWLGEGCEVAAGTELRMFGPEEGLVFIAKEERSYHAEHVNWARVCRRD